MPVATILSQTQPGGVCDMAFHKKAGLSIQDMVREPLGLSQAEETLCRH
jgi:hypothetical protein